MPVEDPHLMPFRRQGFIPLLTFVVYIHALFEHRNGPHNCNACSNLLSHDAHHGHFCPSLQSSSCICSSLFCTKALKSSDHAASSFVFQDSTNILPRHH